MNQALDDVRKHENTILRKSGDGTLSGTKYIWLYTGKMIPDHFGLLYYWIKS